jgi:TonB family protein
VSDRGAGWPRPGRCKERHIAGKRAGFRRRSIPGVAALAAAVVFHGLLVALLWLSLNRPAPAPPKAIVVALLAAPPDDASPPDAPPADGIAPATSPEASAATETPPEEIPPISAPAEEVASAEPPPSEIPAPLAALPPADAAPTPPSPPPPPAKPKRRPHVALARHPQHHADADATSSEPEPPAAHDPSQAGVAVYTVIVDAAGHIRDIVVALSSGEPSLDEAGKGIIRENMAAEPPAPARGGGDGVFTVTLRFSSDPK